MSYTLQTLLDFNLVDQKKYASIISRTLANKGIITIDDLLNMQDLDKYYGIGKKKCEKIAELQAEAANINEENWEQVQKGSRTTLSDAVEPHYLPYNCSNEDTLANLIHRFISEFCECMKKQEKETKPRKNKRISIERKYLDGLSSDAIVLDEDIEITNRERVRQILVNFTRQVGSMILSDTPDYNIFKKQYGIASATLHPLFVAKMKDAYDFAETCPTDKQFAKQLGCRVNDIALMFALDCFDKKICSNIREELHENFISSIHANQLGDCIGVVFDKLEDIVKPFHENELRYFISKKTKIPKGVVIDTVCKILSNSSQFEKVNDGYQLKWPELKSVQSRIERIVYENGTPMEYDSIIREYKRREDVAQIGHAKTIKFNRSKNIHSLKSGVWCWSEKEGEVHINMQASIKSFVAEHKKVDLEEVYAYAKEIDPGANQRSIKSYVTKLCYKTDADKYIYKPCRHEFRNDKLYITSDILLEELIDVMPQDGAFRTIQELTESYSARYGLLAGKNPIYDICYDNRDLFEVTRSECGRGRPVMFRLSSNYKKIYEERNKHKTNRLPRRKAEHTQAIVDEAINMLQSQEENILDKTLLVKEITKYLPKGKAVTVIYKILKNDPIFVSVGNKIKLNSEYFPTQESPNTEMETVEKNERLVDRNETNVRRLRDADYDDIRDNLRGHIETFLEWIERDGMAIKDVNQAWEDFILISGVKKEGTDGAFQRMFRYLHKYLCGSVSIDEKFVLYDELNRRFEEYLSKITRDNEAMLKDQIKIVQNGEILPKECVSCNITKYISNLIYRRNGPSHKDGKTKSDSFMTNSIFQSLILYLYVADRVRLRISQM